MQRPFEETAGAPFDGAHHVVHVVHHEELRQRGVLVYLGLGVQVLLEDHHDARGGDRQLGLLLVHVALLKELFESRLVTGDRECEK